MSLTAIVKPTHGCNLGCKYCYVEEEAEKGIMSEKTRENMQQQLAEVNKESNISIIWHGGEPLLMPKEFYEKARYQQWFLEKEFDCRFDNSIQSNGTLFDQEWADFLNKRDFSIGFSLDGPKSVNNLTRVFKNGKGAYDKIIRGLDIAKENGFGDGFIVVLNKKNLDSLDEIYDFLKERNIGAQLNPLIRSGKAKKNIDELGITPNEYADAMIKLFDRYFQDSDFKRRLDPFDMFIGNVATGEHRGFCTFSKGCQESYISIGPQGDVYPCGRFDGIPEFFMGNLNEIPLDEILEGDKRKELQKRRLENLESCIPCEYNNICHGGCMSNGYMARENFMDRDYYCSAYKKIFKHIDEKVQEELTKAEVKVE